MSENTKPIDELITKFVKIRDGRAEVAARHKEELARFDRALGKLKNYLRDAMTTAGAESIRTGEGTCYFSVKKSATVESRAALIDFIKRTDNWDLVDLRANAKHVDDYLQEHGELPPAVKLNSFQDVGVRRS